MGESTNKADKVPTLRTRKFFISVNVLVQIIAFAAVVVMVNWLARRHYARFDWTTSSYYQVSEKTRQVLQGLIEPVRVIVYLSPVGGADYVVKALEDVRNLLEEMQYMSRGKLTVEYVDPDRNRARAAELVDRYQLSSEEVVIFVCESRHKYVRLDELVDLEGDPFGGGGRVKAFKGEGVFLSAIQTVTEEKPPTVYFLSGHGERDPNDFDQRDGYSTIAAYIKRDNITVERWNILEKQALPEPGGMLIIAGPKKPFSSEELAALQDWLKKNGRLMVMLDPRTKTGLEELLARWGVQVDDNLLLARGGSMLGTELILVNAVGTTYAQHPVTLKLQDINTSFPYARSVRASGNGEDSTADKPRVVELVKTPAAFWGETNLQTERADFDPKTDMAGPLPVAVAVERAMPSDMKLEVGDTRIIVVGSSSTVENGGLTGGNLDFFMSGLNWLLRRETKLAVGPKTPNEFRLDMTVNQTRAVYALVLGGLPLGVAVIGVVVWIRRRK